MSNAHEAGPVPSSTSPSRPPLALCVALIVVGLEALAFLVVAVAEVFSTGSGRVVMAASTAVFFVGYALVMLYCARGMWRGQSSGRSIVVMGQLLQWGVAWSYRESTPNLAGALTITGLVVLVGLFWRSSLRWLADDDA